MNFCSQCGATLQTKHLEGRDRAFCAQCQQVHYRQLKVGAGALIEQDNKLLLFQRAYALFQGAWNLPAGYAEYDEHPSHTVIREVQEETGLQVWVASLQDIFLYL